MIVYGSRGSDLALTQTRWVAEKIRAATGEDFRVEVMVTTGDRIQDRPLSGIGVKGLFTKELEDALRSGAIDAAVHSLKDLPVEDPDGLTVGAVPPREDPRDVLITRREVLAGHARPLDALRAGASLGTSSPRRALAALAARPDLRPSDIRGNVPTRVDKARTADYDAVLLAAAGLNRLGQDLDGLVTDHLPPEVFTPAPGQGALGVQCRAGDERILGALAHLHDETTARCVHAERDILLGLGGGCSMPLGTLVEPVGSRWRLRAALFGGDPNAALRAAAIGDDPDELARAVVASWSPLVGDPLRGRRVATARPNGERTGLAAALAIAGADVTALAWTKAEALDVADADVRAAVAHAAAPQGALAFTSARAVTAFVAACRSQDATPWQRPAFAVGRATETALVQAGFTDVRAAGGRGGEALAAVCAEQGARQVTMPCAVRRHGGFEERAAAAGLDVLALPVYRLVDAPRAAADVPRDLDAFLFTSPSAVEAWSDATSGRVDVPAIAIGETTAAALRARSFERVTTLSEPTPATLVAAVAALPSS